MKKEKKPVGRPRGPMTALRARKEIDALKSLLDDGDIDMRQFHSLKDTILAKLVGGEQ